MRVLVLEDEPDLQAQLAAQLRADGHVVDTADTALDGEFIGVNYPIDVAVVDLGLPDDSGLEVIRRWRSANHTFPILVLTAMGRWQDKVGGLEAGADDYLVKPHNEAELLARLRALARRAAGWAQDLLQIGPYSVDTRRKEVRMQEAVVELTSYEYRVFEHLALHRDKVVSKTELSEHLYEDDNDRDSNVLEVLVGRLRRKLDPDKSINPIETVRGRGYRMREMSQTGS